MINGSVSVLSDINSRIRVGTVTSLLGSNGAGTVGAV